MGSDRKLNLLRQAHLEGLIDCREAQTFDRNWWLKLAWTFDWLEKKNRVEVWKLQHTLNCSLLDYFTGDEALNLHWDQALTLQQRISKSLMPWAPYQGGKMQRKEFRRLVDSWKAVFGDPKDPAVQERIDRTVEALREAVDTASKRGGKYGRS